VVADLRSPQALQDLRRLRAYHPEAPLVVLSNGSGAGLQELRPLAVLPEPLRPGPVLQALRRAFQEVFLHRELGGFQRAEASLVAHSPKMKRLLGLLPRAARRGTVVILCGQRGSGRKLLARAIHERAMGCCAPFVVLREEGQLPRAVEEARGGSLLVECSEALSSQAVGALQGLQAEGLLKWPSLERPFRAELKLMLSLPEGASPPLKGLLLQVPPLKDRREDIVPLAELFLRELCSVLQSRPKHLSPKAKELLRGRPYEGNVKELKDLVHRAYFLSQGPRIRAADVMEPNPLRRFSFREFLHEKLRGYLGRLGNLKGGSRLYETVLGEVERALIELALKETKGNKLRAARALGITRNTLRAKMKQLGLS
jgi:DNA-binding NtrC family response regulator